MEEGGVGRTGQASDQFQSDACPVLTTPESVEKETMCLALDACVQCTRQELARMYGRAIRVSVSAASLASVLGVAGGSVCRCAAMQPDLSRD